MQKALYDVTMDLRDEYTALVNRVVGQQLHSKLLAKLESVEEPGVLILDFSVVTSIHISFLDEFLIPALQYIREGKFGDRYILGANVDRRNLTIDDLSPLLAAYRLLFLMFDKQGEPIILGSDDPLLGKAFAFVQRTEKETAQQLAVQMTISEDASRLLLEQLADSRLIRRGRVTESGPDYYDALIPASSSARYIQHSIQDQIIERLDRLGAIERTAHYQLPSGAHAAEFVHLSRLFEDARFIARCVKSLGDLVRDIDLDVIITTRTPSTVVLAHFLGEYLDCRVVPTVIDPVGSRLTPVSGLTLGENEGVLVLVDVVSTGWIAAQLINCVRLQGAIPRAVAAFLDASGKGLSFSPLPFFALASLTLKVFAPTACPLCASKIPWLPMNLLPRA